MNTAKVMGKSDNGKYIVHLYSYGFDKFHNKEVEAFCINEAKTNVIGMECV